MESVKTMGLIENTVECGETRRYQDSKTKMGFIELVESTRSKESLQSTKFTESIERSRNEESEEFLVSGATLVVRTLQSLGVEVIFGYPGGPVLPIYDALHIEGKPHQVLVRHEQAAAHAADGYARASGKVGVLLVTSGPGATNTITGLMDAKTDSVPVLCISGQVATHLVGTGAFQEANIIAMTKECTKHNYQICNPQELGSEIVRAFNLAKSGRPGPVLIDIPVDILKKQVPMVIPNECNKVETESLEPILDMKLIEKAVDLILMAKKPLIFNGGGVIKSGQLASDNLRELATLIGAPVTSTLMGLGAFPGRHAQFLGMPGMFGLMEANMAMHECDLMICMGVRFDDRITGRVDAFAPSCRKIQIDVDKGSIGKNVGYIDVAFVADLGPALKVLVTALKARMEKEGQTPSLDAWWQSIQEWQSKRCLNFPVPSKGIASQQVLITLAKLTSHLKPIIATDVGQHQMLTAQHMPIDEPRCFITAGGFGTMGFGLPAAYGALIAKGLSTPVILVTSEFSFQMNIQELATLAQHKLPVKIVLLNNSSMCLIRQWQDLLYNGRRIACNVDGNPDFPTLASAYGIRSKAIEHVQDLQDGIIEMVKAREAFILDCKIISNPDCYPVVLPGKAHNEMLLSTQKED